MRAVPSLLLLGLLSLTGCGAADARSETRARAQVTDTATLMQALLAAGAQVSAGGRAAQPFMPVPAHILDVNGASVQVFELADEAAAEAIARRIAPDASSIGPVSISWLAPPHFFRAGRSIVLYVGDDTQVLAKLQRVLGDPIARGRTGVKPDAEEEDVDDWVPTTRA